MMGNTAALAGAGGWNGLKGCAGVAKAGEEDGIALEGPALAFLGAKNGGGGGGLARLAPFSGLFGWSLRGFLGLCIIIILAVFVCEIKVVALTMELFGLFFLEVWSSQSVLERVLAFNGFGLGALSRVLAGRQGW